MRRAGRLFRLVELLRSKRLATGGWLADQLQVSLRTLYRNIHDLTLSGVPIEGEAGVGYRLRYRLDVPPLLFDPAELEALLVGSRMVQAWATPTSRRPPPPRSPRSTTSCPTCCAAKRSARRRCYVRAHPLATRTLLLGAALDTDRLVPPARRVPPLSRRPHRATDGQRRAFPGSVGPSPRRFF